MFFVPMYIIALPVATLLFPVFIVALMFSFSPIFPVWFVSVMLVFVCIPSMFVASASL